MNFPRSVACVAVAVTACASSLAHGATTILPSLRTDLGFTQHWSGNGLNVGSRVWGVHADGGKVYATGDSGLNYSTDGGTTWNYFQNDSFRYQSKKVYASGNSIYTATDFGVRYSADGGSTWDTADSTHGLSTDGGVWDVYANGSTVYAATEYGIAISNDGGASWTNRYIQRLGGGGVTGVRSVRVQDGRIYASSNYGLCTSSDNGLSWQIQNLSQYLGVNEISVSGQRLYVGGGGGLHMSTDGGSTWSLAWTAPSATLDGAAWTVYRVGDTLYGSYGSQGRSGTMISTNGGATWTQYSETAYTVFATESNVYFAGGGMLLIGSPVPAPGAIALLGVAGAVSGRRRRG